MSSCGACHAKCPRHSAPSSRRLTSSVWNCANNLWRTGNMSCVSTQHSRGQQTDSMNKQLMTVAYSVGIMLFQLTTIRRWHTPHYQFINTNMGHQHSRAHIPTTINTKSLLSYETRGSDYVFKGIVHVKCIKKALWAPTNYMHLTD